MIRSFKLLIASLLLVTAGSTTLVAQSSTNAFVLHGNGVPENVMTVMEYCTKSWSQFIKTSVPINVSVSWQELKSNVNAYAKPTNYYATNGIYFPAALAEKLQNRNLNGSQPDIEVVINKNINWFYFDPENPTAVPAEKQYDMVTTIIHELAHGLGYIGNITEESLTNTEFPTPTIFDMFVANSKGEQIISRNGDSFVIDNTDLTTNKLQWGGQFAKAFCGKILHLYAPEKFNSGSTVYHLDEATYPSESGSELMTPMLRSVEIIHQPDMATIAMLAEIGWSDFFIDLDKPKNNSALENPLTISFRVHEKNRDNAKQTLLYSLDEGEHVTEISAVYDSENDIFSAQIPAFPFNHTIHYAICSENTNADKIMFPAKQPHVWFQVFVGTDKTAPTIEHTPLVSVQTNQTKIEIEAFISDNFEVQTAEIQWEIMSGKTIVLEQSTPCNLESGKTTIEISHISTVFTKGDFFNYNIVATDKAGNVAKFFSEDLSVPFEEPQEPVTYFITDFEDNNIVDFFVFDKMNVSTPKGFDNNALHTAHPYASTGIDGKYNNYSAMLKKPIVIAQNPATITFDEVVLVEPGKAGVEFGSFGFWDFVLVEATKDPASNEWQPLGKRGWDSQIAQMWQTHYYSQTQNEGDDENSLAEGNKSLFRSHTINLLENKYFRTGDTVFVRFRLQADATNYAWGWAIDNLKIQERIALPIIEQVKTDIQIFPNPCESWLYCNDNISAITICSLTGETLLQATQMPANIEQLPSGTYIAVLQLTSGKQISKTFVKK